MGRWIGLLLGLVLVIGGTTFFITHGVVPLFQSHAAVSWSSATCAVFDAEITRRVDSDGDVTFHRRLQYSFEHAGRTYQGHRFDFTGVTSSSSERALRKRFPDPGTQVPCWFDPDDPTQSVLKPDGFSVDHTAIPLVLVAVGVAIIGFQNPRSTKRRTRPDGRTELARRNASGPVVLLLAALTGTFLPTGLMMAFTDLGPGFVFAAVGVGLAIAFGYFLLGYLTEVTIQHASLEPRPGDALELTWQVRTPFREVEPTMTLVGREHCEWGSGGSSPSMELHEFHRRCIEADARVPDDAVPTLDLGGNRIEWMVELAADIPWWPDLAIDIPLVIHGARSEARTAPAPLPIRNQRPIALDAEAFAPGAPITGTIQWRRDEAPRRATVTLHWTSTSAKSTYTAIVGAIEVADLPTLIDDPTSPYRSGDLQEGPAEPLARTERRRLHMVAPDAPYTFAGKLIKVKWQVELAIEARDGSIETARASLAISPTAPASRPSLPSPTPKKKERRSRRRRR